MRAVEAAGLASRVLVRDSWLISADRIDRAMAALRGHAADQMAGREDELSVAKGGRYMEATVTHSIDTLSYDELRSLIKQPVSICTSLFLPIEWAEPARQQNWIRLENLLRQAETMLLARDLSLAEAQDLLAPAWQLTEERSFWAHQSAGLAIFAAPELFRVYRLPRAFEELVVVDEQLHIAPLLPLVQQDGRYYLLELGLDRVQLLHATHYEISPVPLHDMPTSLKDALKYDEFAKQAQFHPGIRGRGGERGAIFHGQGARDDRLVKEKILRYFQQVDRSVQAVLREERAPLLLAGIAYLLPIYRSANSYPHLLEQTIACNRDDLTRADLLARAWKIVAPNLDLELAAAADRYGVLAWTHPAQATNYLRAIVPAAYAGRIATLFVATGQRRWGTFDPNTTTLTVHEAAEPRDIELVNDTIIHTLLNGGTVYVVTPARLPEAAPLAAMFRY